MRDRFVRYCRMAEFARRDHSVIQSQIETGIPGMLQQELNEIETLLNEPAFQEDRDFIARMNSDKRDLKYALTAYDNYPLS